MSKVHGRAVVAVTFFALCLGSASGPALAQDKPADQSAPPAAPQQAPSPPSTDNPAAGGSGGTLAPTPGAPSNALPPPDAAPVRPGRGSGSEPQTSGPRKGPGAAGGDSSK
jgi:hypothetical protein